MSTLSATDRAALAHFAGLTPFGSPAPDAETTKRLADARLVAFNSTGYEATATGRSALSAVEGTPVRHAGACECPDCCPDHPGVQFAQGDDGEEEMTCTMCGGKGWLTDDEAAELCL